MKGRVFALRPETSGNNPPNYDAVIKIGCLTPYNKMSVFAPVRNIRAVAAEVAGDFAPIEKHSLTTTQ